MSNKVESVLELKNLLRKGIFSLLEIEPNQEFGLKPIVGEQYPHNYQLNNNLSLLEDGRLLGNNDGNELLLNILRGIVIIVESIHSKALKDLTANDYDNWVSKHCGKDVICSKCIFSKVNCYHSSITNSWINNKEMYSELFLEQEIEV